MHRRWSLPLGCLWRTSDAALRRPNSQKYRHIVWKPHCVSCAECLTETTTAADSRFGCFHPIHFAALRCSDALDAHGAKHLAEREESSRTHAPQPRPSTQTATQSSVVGGLT
ncbi:hypothetical protein TRVL_06561 [Trypanosoma vivax]|nr:hypothetical protein TRVL_06561 [Trypanosoma vivax]